MLNSAPLEGIVGLEYFVKDEIMNSSIMQQHQLIKLKTFLKMQKSSALYLGTLFLYVEKIIKETFFKKGPLTNIPLVRSTPSAFREVSEWNMLTISFHLIWRFFAGLSVL